jgi:DNA-directed RNA polymerase subunit RPC12/RpoP
MPKRLTTEEYKVRIKIITKGKYTVLEDYINTNTPILHRHNICGYEFKKRPNNFLNGQRCPKCSKKEEIKKRTKTLKNYKQDVYNLVKDEYTVLSSFYKTNKVKILHRHNTCGHEYKVRPDSFIRGRRCPKCYGTKLKSTKEYKSEIYNLVKDEYSVLEDYINANVPILHRHNICKNEYYVRPVDFLKKHKPNRCPQCSNKISKGESRIMRFLNSNKIDFDFNFRYDGEIDKKFKYITFDFKINDYLFIEYDGRLHFESFSNSKRSIQKFKNQQKRDKYKDKLCKENNIKLIRIKYTDYDNIEKILQKELIE